MDRFLSRLVDIGLRGVILVAPLFMGGRHPVGVFVLVTLVALIALFACLRWGLAIASRSEPAQRCLRFGAIEYCFLAGVLLLGLQLAPLIHFQDGTLLILGDWIPGGSTLSEWIGSQRAFLLSAWNGETPANGPLNAIGQWHTLSLHPHATRTNLILLSAYAVLFTVAVNHLRSASQVASLLRFIGFSLAAFSLFGIVQYLFGNGKYFWIYDQPLRGVARCAQGPFTNPNHFAHFIALGIGPLIWLLFSNDSPKSELGSARRGSSSRHPLDSGSQKRLRPLESYRTLDWVGVTSLHTKVAGVSCLGLILACGAMSLSRGGMLAHGVAVCVAAGIALLSSKKIIPAISAVAVAASVASLFVFTNGFDSVQRELNTISLSSTQEIGESIGRDIAWDSAIATFQDLPAFGAGAGTYRDVYKTYLSEDVSKEYTHAENGYLQVLSENGTAGTMLLAISIMTIAWYAHQLLRSRFIAFAIAILPGIAISLLHSLVDFVWYIPACFTLTTLLIACLGSLYRMDRDTQTALLGQRASIQSPPLVAIPRVAFLLAVVFAAPFGLRETWNDATANQHWEAYLSNASVKSTLNQELDPATRMQQVDQGLTHLQACLKAQPKHARAHLRTAELLLHKFQWQQQSDPMGMGLQAYAEAARLSNYETNTELHQWLDRALGERRLLLTGALRHAHRSVELCPLQGEGYVVLAQLAFLVPEAKWDVASLLEQAVRVRPSNGEMLVAAADIYQQEGNLRQRDELLATALRINRNMRSHILKTLAFHMTAEQIAERLSLDRDGLAALVNFYSKHSMSEQIAASSAIYFARVESDSSTLRRQERGALMKQAASISRRIKNPELALHYSLEALECTPNDFDLRRSVGQMLLASGDSAAAQEHLRWCVTRRPNDAKVKAALRQAISTKATVLR